MDVCPKANSPTDKQGIRTFTDKSVCVCVGGGGVGAVFTCRNSTAISNSHLLMGSGLTSIILIVSDEVPGSICSHCFVVNSHNCGSSWPEYSLSSCS